MVAGSFAACSDYNERHHPKCLLQRCDSGGQARAGMRPASGEQQRCTGYVAVRHDAAKSNLEIAHAKAARAERLQSACLKSSF